MFDKLEDAVPILEFRNGTLASNYRSLEKVVGAPAPVPAKRRNNSQSQVIPA